MAATSVPASVAIDGYRRKRLGQYFTGERLATLLAAIARADSAKSIIDPMGGSGDMLAGCLNVGTVPKLIASVDIDRAAVEACRERFATHGDRFRVVHGSAFDIDVWNSLKSTWDLVITNPPYVRYQTGGSPDDAAAVPSAEAVRSALLQTLTAEAPSVESDLGVFKWCAENYSGLADLAVPSWILCAALVKEGGHLAMVVPDTWLSRDYAFPVLYILRRFFDLEFVVRDTDVAWFDDALVRTTLVVARRTPAKEDVPSRKEGYLNVDLPKSAGNRDSLVGGVFSDTGQPEKDLAEWLTERRRNQEGGRLKGLEASWSDGSDILESLRANAARHSWFSELENTSEGWSKQAPERLGNALSSTPRNLVALDELGWTVGQGLRTGANDFFYLTRTEDGSLVSPLLPGEAITLPEKVLLDAIRNQRQLPETLERKVSATTSKLLFLEGWALPEDASTSPADDWQVMDGDLRRLVRAAAAKKYSRAGKEVALPNLSAVRTNARPAEPHNKRARFWYHLPKLQPRHRPVIYIPRVNGRQPIAFYNESSAVVDANFSTLWPTSETAIPALAVLALLSSYWARAFLELTGTVMGGGALKLEATQLRRLYVPAPSEDQIKQLERVGRELVAGSPTQSTLEKVDAVVANVFRPRLAPSSITKISSIADQAHQARKA